jgi:hypothetical protein
MATRLAAELPGRRVHVTADSAYAGEELKQLPDGVTWTTRLRSNAALHGLPPERTGKKGRPRVKGGRLPSLAKIAAAAAFSHVTVTRYGKAETIAAAVVTCLWYSVTGTRPVTVILIRDKSGTGYDLALVTTEKNPDTTRARRLDAPWYTAKTEPSTADMTAKLRRVIIAAKFKPVCPDQPEPAEIHAIRLAWEDVEDIAA